MAKVLLVDDDRALLDALSLALENERHEIVTATDGIEGLAAAEREKPDVIVSDITMPGLDGFALCKRLRDRKIDVPIVLLTSRDSEIDEALGLELGADDYVTKPFHTRILLARISALLRRESLRTAKRGDVSHVALGKLTLDSDCLEAKYAGAALTLTLTEFRMLEALASRPGIVLSRTRLLELVRGDDSVVADRIVDTYVRRLRKKIETIDASFADLETVVGAGYRWRR